MTQCEGKGYPGCASCINREFDPFECDECEDESHWESDGNEDESQWGTDSYEDVDQNNVEEISMLELIHLINGEA